LYYAQELDETGMSGEKPGEIPTPEEKNMQAAKMRAFFSKEQARRCVVCVWGVGWCGVCVKFSNCVS